jgi:hypothetical protein
MVAAKVLVRVTLCWYHYITSLIYNLRTTQHQHVVD